MQKIEETTRGSKGVEIVGRLLMVPRRLAPRVIPTRTYLTVEPPTPAIGEKVCQAGPWWMP